MGRVCDQGPIARRLTVKGKTHACTLFLLFPAGVAGRWTGFVHAHQKLPYFFKKEGKRPFPLLSALQTAQARLSRVFWIMRLQN